MKNFSLFILKKEREKEKKPLKNISPGVRLLPELDQPAHVAHGWQFPGAEDLVVCKDIEPFYDYCYEPPCGQLNPTKEKVYDLLEMIYKEWFDIFKFDQFHLGADEVSLVDKYVFFMALN